MADDPQPTNPGDGLAKTSGEVERSARDSYHGGQAAPDGEHALGRKDPQESGDADRDKENVPQR